MLNLSYRTPIAPPPPSNQQNYMGGITQSMDWDYYDDDELEEFQFHNDLINSVYQRTSYTQR